MIGEALKDVNQATSSAVESMEFTRLTRREFIKRTSSAGAVASASNALLPAGMLQAGSTPLGRKGQSYPDQRKKHTDSKSGRTVWQLTDSAPGRTAGFSYYNVPKTTPDGRWALYMSDRSSATPGMLDIFKMDLRTGESVQLTETSDMLTKDSVVMTADGREVYFFDKQNNLRVVEMESFKERTITRLVGDIGSPDHNSTITPDKRFLLTPRRISAPIEYGYVYQDWAGHHALMVIRTDNGQTHNLVEGMMPVGIAEYCPTDDNLLLWDQHAGWAECHRPFVMRTDGTSNRPVMLTIKGETSGHQFWGWNGASIFSVHAGGARLPQGLWACGRDGSSNERCVMHGPTIAHCTVSPEEDRFVADEVFGVTDALFMSRKGSLKAEILCQTADWFQTREGVRQATPYHPHSRFLPTGNAVAFNGPRNIFMVEL